MLTSLVVIAPPGAYWPDFEVKFVPDPGSPVVLLDVAGLEPVAAAVSTRPMAEIDGESYTGAKVGKRNIVLKLGLLTPEARNTLYGFFLPKSQVKLRLNFDNRPYLEINGVIETMTEADRFSEAPALPGMQISVICPSPNFHSEFHTVSGVSGIDPEETDLPYLGTAGGGFMFEMEVGDEDLDSDLQIISYVDGTSAYKTMAFNNVTIVADWTIFINTQRGAKRAEFRPPALLAEAADPISMLGLMVDTYFWTQFFAANHKVRVTTPGSDVPRPWTITYTDQYAGI